MPIVDQGYQHWTGHLAGHTWRWLAIARHGFRIGMKDWKTRIVVLFAWLPAIGLAAALCLWGLLERNPDSLASFADMIRAFGFGPDAAANPRLFRLEFWTIAYSTFMGMELFLAMILIVLVGRQLISQDLRFNAIPLYFSRPLRRIDYFLGKLGVIGGYLAMVMIVPSLIAYALGMAFSLDVSILRDTLPLLLRVLAYGLVIIISTGTLILAISSLSRNSRNVGLMWVALWFISNIAAGILNSAYMFQRANFRDPGAMASLNFDTTNWRPMVSYTENLSRIGRQLMGTDDCWRTLASSQPQERRFFLARSLGPQYPWTWSLAVLAAVFLLSVLILRFRVRSLDRLK